MNKINLQNVQCQTVSDFQKISTKARQFKDFEALLYGPVTLLRMIETYELRMKIISCIVIRTKKPLKIQISAYTYLIEPMSIV